MFGRQILPGLSGDGSGSEEVPEPSPCSSMAVMAVAGWIAVGPVGRMTVVAGRLEAAEALMGAAIVMGPGIGADRIPSPGRVEMTLVATDSGGASGQIRTMACRTIQGAVAVEGRQVPIHPFCAGGMSCAPAAVTIMTVVGAVAVGPVKVVASVAGRNAGRQGVMRKGSVGPTRT